MNGSTANLGQVAGEYDSRCASGLDVAWAGAQFGGNLALNVVPGGGEARAREVAAVAAEHAVEDAAGGIGKDVLKEAEGRTFAVDPHGNTIPLEPGESLAGSPNGKFLQVRDAGGKPTGMRIDGPHNPNGHPDPRSHVPHGHVPGVLNEDGTPWLPINR